MNLKSCATLNIHGAPEITPQHLQDIRGQVELIDVRRPDEFTGELGHIDGARLVTLETELEGQLPQWDKSKTYVFVCRSGQRSSRATNQALELGFKEAFNLKGGMLLWNTLQLPVNRERS
jgi:rhodanese-related sulfurtransferase